MFFAGSECMHDDGRYVNLYVMLVYLCCVVSFVCSCLVISASCATASSPATVSLLLCVCVCVCYTCLSVSLSQ